MAGSTRSGSPLLLTIGGEFPLRVTSSRGHLPPERSRSLDNFLACGRSRQEPNLSARLGDQAMAAIAMGVQAYRQSEVPFFDRRREKVTNKPVST